MENTDFGEILKNLSSIDAQRKEAGFLSLAELLQLQARGNIVLDPFSTLISASVDIGQHNRFYPGVVIEVKLGGNILVGNSNVFYPNSIFCAEQAEIVIGNSNCFGDGGVSVKANTKGSQIHIGDNGRYINGVQVLGKSYLGSGSQVIGNITVQDCYLEEGESFLYPDAALRGGVLKGQGLARNIRVAKGLVINGQGTFNQAALQCQSFYHPK